MIEARVFDEDERLELIEGVIIRMSPQSPQHTGVIRYLNKVIARALPEGLALNPQLPLSVSDTSEPEPDLAVVEIGDADRREHPKTARLVIEVARDSLRKDRGVKAGLYARTGIPEYWIVNVEERAIEVHRDPDPAASRYRTVLTFAPDQELRSVAVPEVRVAVKDVLPL